MSIPDEVLEEFDDQLWEYQREEVFPRGRLRSTLVTKLMSEWVNESDEWVEENEDWVAELWESEE